MTLPAPVPLDDQVVGAVLDWATPLVAGVPWWVGHRMCNGRGWCLQVWDRRYDLAWPRGAKATEPHGTYGACYTGCLMTIEVREGELVIYYDHQMGERVEHDLTESRVFLLADPSCFEQAEQFLGGLGASLRGRIEVG